MTDLLQDVRYGLRVLRRARGFTVLAVLVLGAGIAASTVIFSALNRVLLRPLPYADPDRLVAIWESNADQREARAGTSAPTLTEWRRSNRTFEGLAAYRPWGYELLNTGEPERLQGARVSANLFSLLRVAALHGRTFVSGEDLPGAPPVALVSEELWRRRFGADPGLLNSRLELNGQMHSVVGIVPAGFVLPRADVWVPLIFAPYEMEQRGNRALTIIGRRKVGRSLADARSDLHAIAVDMQRRFPAAHAGWDVRLTSLHDDIAGASRTPLLVLFSATSVVLLAACANIAILVLARSTARRREIAVRASLGAGRGRIVRQLVTESMLLVAAATCVGLVTASFGNDALNGLRGTWLPAGAEVRIDPVVLAFVLLIAIVTGAALSMVAAFDAAQLDLAHVIKTGVPSGRQRWHGVDVRDLLVTGQVALALLLLVGGGLLVRSFLRAQAVELGFSPRNVLSMTLSLPGGRYGAPEQRAAFFQELSARVAVLPGVRAAGVTSQVPLAGGALLSDLSIEEVSVGGGVEPGYAHLVNVTPGYFEAMRVGIISGRLFSADDRLGRQPVVMVDETLAHRHWPQGSAVGKRLRVGSTLGADTAWREVIGVVTGVRTTSVERAPEPTLYLPHAQNPWPSLSLLVSTIGAPDGMAQAVINEVRSLDPSRPVYNVRSVEAIVGRQLAPRRLQTLLMAGFAASALVLAVLGVYGMLAYAVAQRAREMGIRVALGAQRRAIVWLCLRGAILRIVAGLTIGTVAALAAVRFLDGLLFALDPWDPVTFVSALLLLGGTGVAASCIPALRAARLDPMVTLRRE